MLSPSTGLDGSIAEHAGPGTPVSGIQLRASDPEGAGVITWSLHGTDARMFSLTNATGPTNALELANDAPPLDSDTQSVYRFTVRVTDSFGGQDNATVTVSVVPAPVASASNGYIRDSAEPGDVVSGVMVSVSDRVMIWSVGEDGGEALFDVGNSTGHATGLVLRPGVSLNGTAGVHHWVTVHGVDEMGQEVEVMVVVAVHHAFVPTSADWMLHSIYDGPDGCCTRNEAEVADMDGDGMLDVVSVAFDGNTVQWHHRVSPSGVWVTDTIATLSKPNRLHLVDMDDDGDADVVVTAWGGNSLSWIENRVGNDTGDSWLLHSISTLNRPGGVYCADIDEDGDVDVAASSSSAVLLFENRLNTEGGWVQQTVASLSGPKNLMMADVDGDDSLDIVSASKSDNTIAWHSQGNDGSWVTHIVSTQSMGPMSVHVVDMDDDGDMDILSASNNGDEVALYVNDLPSTWNKTVLSSSADYASWVTVADLHHRGVYDVLATSTGTLDSKVRMFAFESLELDTWSETVISSALNGPTGAVTADMDGDGDLDVVATSNNDDQVVWFESIAADNAAPCALYVPVTNTTLLSTAPIGTALPNITLHHVLSGYTNASWSVSGGPFSVRWMEGSPYATLHLTGSTDGNVTSFALDVSVTGGGCFTGGRASVTVNVVDAAPTSEPALHPPPENQLPSTAPNTTDVLVHAGITFAAHQTDAMATLFARDLEGVVALISRVYSALPLLDDSSAWGTHLMMPVRHMDVRVLESGTSAGGSQAAGTTNTTAANLEYIVRLRVSKVCDMPANARLMYSYLVCTQGVLLQVKPLASRLSCTMLLAGICGPWARVAPADTLRQGSTDADAADGITGKLRFGCVHHSRG